MLVRCGCRIEVTAWLNPLVTAMYSEIEEEIRYSTTTFKFMLYHSGDFEVICKDEGKLKEIATALVHNKTVE